MIQTSGVVEARLAVSRKASRACGRFLCSPLCVLYVLCGSVLADPPFYPDKTKLLIWRDEGGQEQPIKKAADWTKRRDHILANMQLVMGNLPDKKQKVPLDVQCTEAFKTA